MLDRYYTPPFLSVIKESLPRLEEDLTIFRIEGAYYPKSYFMRQPLEELELKYAVGYLVACLLETNAVHFQYHIWSRQLQDMYQNLLVNDLIDIHTLEAVFTSQSSGLHVPESTHIEFQQRVLEQQDYPRMMETLFTERASIFMKQELDVLHHAHTTIMLG